MANKKPPLPHGGIAIPLPKKIHGFLGLPGELRNRIYGYYFEMAFRAEFAAKYVR